MNFINSLKAAVLGVLTTVTTAVSPIIPTYTPAPKLTIISQPVQNPLASSIPANKPTPTNTPSPLNQSDNLNIQGTYSYFGQSIKYSLSVPKNGGQFTGKTEGAYQAEVSGPETFTIFYGKSL